MRRKPMIITTLECPICGQKMFVPRAKNALREKGHIKDMWCICCKKTQKFIQLDY